jgi:hypothetical protein
MAQTFLEKIFCTENVIVATRALPKPIRSKEISVADAIMTPVSKV